MFCDAGPSVFLELAKIPAIRSICLWLSSRPVHDSLTTEPYNAPSLEQLTLMGAPAGLTRLLVPLRAAALTSLELTLITNVPGGWHECDVACMRAAANAVSPASLRTITLDLGAYWGSVELMTVLQPLLQLPTITRFELRMLSLASRPSLTMTEDGFARIAEAWVHIEVLNIVGSWGPAAPTPSAIVLLYFWKSCPRLRQLSLPYLNLDVEPELLTDRLPAKPSSHGLKRLYIYSDLFVRPRSTLDSNRTREWASYVLRLFTFLESTSDPHMILDSPWRNVTQEMWFMRSARDGRADA
ncbi:hypothetical protein K466DRAFT_182158 [Polyporus arcularius HHB13444]|uniref:F-box domain-containing protein n=1 Tax=Polyporus arcularius HHB13444 TaxID=1314778 RepID=A0A5C3PYI4_9APHY|nr:hypothetical protein K466DRAFT_182158 [Polyporus arcularius HHB13444]